MLLNENPKKNRAEAPNPELDAVHAQLLQVDKVLAFRSKTYYFLNKGPWSAGETHISET